MSKQKTVFITGAAMGMGALKARTLAERGWRVFAGVLPGADTSELGEHENITAVEQDVTNTESVKASAATVAAALGDDGLDLLINNAGIANSGVGVIEGADMDAAMLTFEVNTFGTWRVIQAFLSLVRKNAPTSRVINFASGAVKANPVGSGAYNMSKHAVVGLTRTLRHELAPLGVQVTAVEPGAVKTHMTADSKETTQDIWRKVSQEIRDVYEVHHREGTCEALPKMIEEKGNEAQYVVDEVLALLEIKNWKPSYLVGKDAKPLGPMYKILPERTFEKIIQGASKIKAYKG